MTKHVDDLKLTGEKDWIEFVLKKLEETFGELKVQWHEFTNCGVRHIQDVKANTVSLDQIE